MNELTFLRYKGKSEEDDIIVPVVDGIPLVDLHNNDSDGGLRLSFVVPPSKQWLGEPEYDAFDRTVLIDGSCGIADCCGVEASVTIKENSITWTDFFCNAQDGVPDASYEFDRLLYEKAINAISNLPRLEWPDDES